MPASNKEENKKVTQRVETTKGSSRAVLAALSNLKVANTGGELSVPANKSTAKKRSPKRKLAGDVTASSRAKKACGATSEEKVQKEIAEMSEMMQRLQSQIDELKDAQAKIGPLQQTIQTMAQEISNLKEEILLLQAVAPLQRTTTGESQGWEDSNSEAPPELTAQQLASIFASPKRDYQPVQTTTSSDEGSDFGGEFDGDELQLLLANEEDSKSSLGL